MLSVNVVNKGRVYLGAYIGDLIVTNYMQTISLLRPSEGAEGAEGDTQRKCLSFRLLDEHLERTR